MLARLASADADWTDSLDRGYLRSQVNDRPMFIFIGSDRVEISRQVWRELQTPQWTQRLAQWTAVQLNSDAISPAVRSLGVVGAPAIRLLAPDGKLLAAHDGFVSVDEFSSWWIQQEKRQIKASSMPAESIETAERLRQLGDENVALREAAIRQLRAAPALAPQVVDLLSTGSLAQRLSAIDLLDQWQAPTTGMNPWQPGTITEQRRIALTNWLKSHPTTQPSSAAAASVGDELDALLLATTEIQARAVRQRLAKYGPSILPQVYDRLKKNTREPARHRLMALRYRLVATDALAAEWPGGFDRLASSDPEIRRVAVTDLAAHAKPDDHRLLSEMFADDDPFVRAQSLKLLSSFGGPETSRELIALLADPEPNVRAAVLDTFAETPDARVVGALVKYAATETNTDLVVHVVHVLELTPGDDSFDALQGMLKHPQWRVRGEAAEAFTGKLNEAESNGIAPEDKQEATQALVKLLDDPDGYVVSRAAGTLIKSAFEASARALMKRVPNRPDLAPDVLKALSEQSSVGQSFVPRIRLLTASTRPSIRASAVMALASLASNACGGDMAKALRDPDVGVREAALHGTQQALVSLTPIDTPPPTTEIVIRMIGPQTLPTPQGIAAFCAGKNRPQWLNDMQPDLEKSLTEPATRVPAATILCALGKDEQAMPVLLAVQRGEVHDAAMALVWLPWDQKFQLYKSLLAQVGADKGSIVIEQFAAVADPRITQELWNLLGPGTKPEDFAPVYQVLQKLYLGGNYYNAQNLPAEQKPPIIAALLQRVHEGVDLQRSAALAMLLSIAPRQAAAAAQSVRDDPHSTEWGQMDALQIELGAQPQKTADKLAIAALAEPAMRKIALAYLAAGTSEIRRLRGEVYLYFTRNSEASIDGQPIPVTVPSGLDTELTRGTLRQVLSGNDPEQAGYAAYLLGLLGDRSGFEILVSNWRSHNQSDPWSRMLYRVIAKNNDDTQVPLLAEIYRGYAKRNTYYLREMYWTLRTTTGPNTLKFLKTMNKDQSLSQLNGD